MPPRKLDAGTLELIISDILPHSRTLAGVSKKLHERTGIRLHPRTIADAIRRGHPGTVVGTILGSAIAVDQPPAPDTEALLKRRVRDLEKQLRAAQKEAEGAHVVRKVLGDLVEADFRPPSWLAPRRPGKVSATPVLFLSDLHWGETVYPEQVDGSNAYNMETARTRLRRVVDRAIHLCDSVFADSDYPGIVLACGGDLVSGTIHEELNENSPPIFECLLDLAEHLAAAVDTLRARFGRVFIPWVTGNHGRLHKKPRMKNGPVDNYEWVLGRFLESKYRDDPAVTFYVPDSFTAHFRVHGTRFLLVHGDGFRGGSGIAGPFTPWSLSDHRLRKQMQSMTAWTSKPTEYDLLLFGHFHQLHLGRHWIANGSLVGFSEYAKKKGFPFEPPQQALFFVSPKYGVVFATPVFAEDPPKKERTTEWVTVAG